MKIFICPNGTFLIYTLAINSFALTKEKQCLRDTNYRPDLTKDRFDTKEAIKS